MYRILEYSANWRDALSIYMHKVFPTYSDSYIKYCIDHSAGHVPSIIVTNEKNEIVGCHLYYCTKVLLNGKVIETQWGHDTFLDQNYRKEAGVDFLLARKKIPTFGVGLTETNAKMRKLMKSVFLSGVYNYYTITPMLFLTPFQKILHLQTNVKEISEITVGDVVFKKTSSSMDIPIPNDGFWFKDYNELDFIRDAEFINDRFLNCMVYDYKVFASMDSYFVVRLSSYRGFPAMMLSDFRYDPFKKDSAISMLKAVRKLAVKSKIGIIYFVCRDREVEKFFKRKLHYKTPIDCIASYNIPANIDFTLSGGDSDAEFLKK